MRTTIELKDEHRARLLEIAARHGEKGFSAIVTLALEAYFEIEETRRTQQKQVLELRGALDEQEAEELLERTEAIRNHWR
jgi:predicted transcriptional regulator